MTERIETDVLVIGSGPTGLTAANLLADYGVSVTLIERNPGSGDEPRAISATDETLRVMQRLGVMDVLAPEMLMDTGARYFGRGGKVIADVRPGAARLGQPGKSQFDQPVMEGALYEAARTRAAIDLHYATEAIRITEQQDSVTVSARRHGERTTGHNGALAGDQGLDTTIAADAPTHDLEITAKWVLACDGGKSFTRRELGVKLIGSTQVERWIVVDLLDVPGTPEPFASFHANGERPAVVVPGVKGRRRYEFMLFDHEDGEAMITPEVIAELVAPYQDISKVTVRRAAVYTAHQRVAESYRQGRILLAGDAAHLMPPFAGQGLNAGIRDAAGAAWRIAAHIKGAGTEALLDDYQLERRPHAAQMVKLSKLIGSVVMNTNPVITRLRDVIVPATRIVPPLNRWLTQMRFLKQPHYLNGTVYSDVSGVPPLAAELLGRSLPQPTVRVADSELALDELLGTGWAWVDVAGHRKLVIETESGERTAAEDTAGVFEHAAGTVLLVRPDGYVAAVVPTLQRARALEGLAAKLPGLFAGAKLGN